MSSPVTPKCMMNSLEQDSSVESTGGSTTDDVSKKFRSLVKIYVDTLEKELDTDELIHLCLLICFLFLLIFLSMKLPQVRHI